MVRSILFSLCSRTEFLAEITQNTRNRTKRMIITETHETLQGKTLWNHTIRVPSGL